MAAPVLILTTSVWEPVASANQDISSQQRRVVYEALKAQWESDPAGTLGAEDAVALMDLSRDLKGVAVADARKCMALLSTVRPANAAEYAAYGARMARRVGFAAACAGFVDALLYRGGIKTPNCNEVIQSDFNESSHFSHRNAPFGNIAGWNMHWTAQPSSEPREYARLLADDAVGERFVRRWETAVARDQHVVDLISSAHYGGAYLANHPPASDTKAS